MDMEYWLDQIEQFPEREKRKRILAALVTQAQGETKAEGKKRVDEAIQHFLQDIDSRLK